MKRKISGDKMLLVFSTGFILMMAVVGRSLGRWLVVTKNEIKKNEAKYYQGTFAASTKGWWKGHLAGDTDNLEPDWKDTYNENVSTLKPGRTSASTSTGAR